MTLLGSMLSCREENVESVPISQTFNIRVLALPRVSDFLALRYSRPPRDRESSLIDVSFSVEIGPQVPRRPLSRASRFVSGIDSLNKRHPSRTRSFSNPEVKLIIKLATTKRRLLRTRSFSDPQVKLIVVLADTKLVSWKDGGIVRI